MMMGNQRTSWTLESALAGRARAGEVVQIPDMVRARCGYSPTMHPPCVLHAPTVRLYAPTMCPLCGFYARSMKES